MSELDFNLESLVPKVVEIATAAAVAILDVYHDQKGFDVTLKSDNSPVTKADLRSHQIISEGLRQLPGQFPVISEEEKAPAFKDRQAWPYYWLIDPLDGTKEFIERTDEFTINIALIHNNQPILGVVAVPMRQGCYWAIKDGAAYWEGSTSKEKISVTQSSNQPLRVAISRHHHSESRFEKLLKEREEAYNLIYCGSTLKMCLIAHGKADVYPRYGKTSEWDTAAGQCILIAAGGQVVDTTTGSVLRYNTKESLLNPGFIAIGQLRFDITPFLCG